MYNLYCRVYQFVFKWFAYLLPWRQPILLEGKDGMKQLADVVLEKNKKKALIVSDKTIVELKLMDSLLKQLSEHQIGYVIYSDVVPNPTINNIEDALKLYKNEQCNFIIAFGGGSPMDCAKGVAARIARPNRLIPSMKGQLKVRRKMPLFFAIPTTAGTGSEATLAAVITDDKTHEKYAINDVVLIPHYAVLDPQITLTLPPNITSTTGMDTLTHAIEAYIGNSNTKTTKKCSKEAVILVHQYLYTAYENGQNFEARKNMLKASYYAGVAFTRAYVGYVHAISHALGGFYGLAHGKTNAIVLPYVLRYYGDAVHLKLSELADLIELGSKEDDAGEKTQLFIEYIESLNKRMNIPSVIHEIRQEDIPTLAKRAINEANPLYPVPRILREEDLKTIIQSMMS